MIVKYVSNHTDYRGFAANYEAICGGDIDFTSAYSGKYIESPNYPESYSANKDCTWRTSIPQLTYLMVEFEKFDLESHPNCRNEFFELNIGEDWLDESFQPKRYCGKSLPPILHSPWNMPGNTTQLVIRFVSNGSYQGKGFSAFIMASNF